MESITKLSATFCILLAFAQYAFPQTTDATTYAQLWHSRAETITADLVKETANINELDRALLFAELGSEWYESDAQKADAFFERSVDTLFFYSREDEPDKFLETARKTLVLLAGRNPKQSERLIRIIADEKDVSDKNKDLNANALVEYALEIVDSDPASAYRFGEIAIKIGTPNELHKLIWLLNKANNGLAVRLFNNAVSRARNDPSYYRLQSVQLAAFPEVLSPDVPEEFKLNRSEKVTALKLLAEMLAQLRTKYLTKQIPQCSNEALIVRQVQNYYPEFLPEQIGTVQQSIATCLEDRSQPSQGLSDDLKNATVEELLKLAEEHKDDPVLRTAYLYRAALLSHEEKRYDLAISILEKMTDKERSADPDFWDELRSSAASHLAFERYKGNDSQGARKILSDVPEPIKAFAQYGFVKLFPIDDASSLPLRSEILKEAKKNFIRTDEPFIKKGAYWFRLVGLMSRVGLRTEAADTFRDLVKSLNNENENFEITRTMAENSFPAELIEAADLSLAESVRLIKDPASRIVIKLTLLRVALHQFKTISENLPSTQ
jgi:hypothetical protein